MSNIEKKDLNIVLGNLQTAEEYQILLDSGAIPSSLSTAQMLMTVVTMGKELGMPPMVAINNINIIKGRTVISSAMLGAMLKQRNIEWVWTKDFHTEDDGRIITELEFEYLSKVSGRPKTAKFSTSWQEMERAGYTSKDNWSKYPKPMLRARTLAYAVRAMFPEILLGYYTELEIADVSDSNLNVKINDAGDVIIEEAEIVQDSNDIEIESK